MRVVGGHHQDPSHDQPRDRALNTSPAPTRAVIGGIATNFHDEGAGPQVLFLHGSGPGVSAWSNWRLSIPVLADRFRVVAPDQLGFGATAAPADRSYSRDRWVSHVVGLLDHLEIERTHVVGNSFGGAIALRLAIEHPKRVERLVLMGSVGVTFDITPGLDQAWGYTPSIENMRAMLDSFAFDRSLVTEELAQMRYEASIQLGVQEAFAAMFPAPRQRWIDALASEDDEIKRIEAETLIIHGRDDQIIPLSNSMRLLDLINHSQLHVFGRSGHWVQIEHAEEFARLVGDFLS
ncbi:MAG: alpha/beta fold hydrolase [Acidimicrobiia bacterium]